MKADVWDILPFLLEGKDDSKHRHVAEELLSSAEKAIRSGHLKPKFEDVWDRGEEKVGWTHAGSISKEHHSAVYDLSFLPGGEGLELSLDVSAGGKQGGSYGPGKSGRSRITIIGFDADGKFTGDEQKVANWKKMVERSGSKLLAKYHDIFVHEYVHHIDKNRMRPNAWNRQAGRAGGASLRAGGGQASSYYNNPLELNAFVQQSLHKIASQLRQTKTPQGRRLIMGSTPQEFFNNIMKRAPAEFTKHLSPENRKKLAKRAYQLWGELVKQQPTQT